MCRAVRCKTCNKTTWDGCGQHIASVKAGVPADQWCGGHDKSETTTGDGVFRRLFGR